MDLPHEFVWRGYRFRRDEGKDGRTVLRCSHKDVTMELAIDPKNEDVLVATIRSHTFAGHGYGPSEGQALANCLMTLRNTLKKEINAGAQAKKNLERIRSMF